MAHSPGLLLTQKAFRNAQNLYCRVFPVTFCNQVVAKRLRRPNQRCHDMGEPNVIGIQQSRSKCFCA